MPAGSRGGRAARKRRRATIVDVARHAGVSKGLVSFVVNDRPGRRSATRERILASVEELGWRPSRTARSLATERADAVGFVLARPAALLAADPFFPAFVAGIESELSARNASLVLQVVADLDAELEVYRRMAADHRVDGVLLADLRVDDRARACSPSSACPRSPWAGRTVHVLARPWCSTGRRRGRRGGRAPRRPRPSADRIRQRSRPVPPFATPVRRLAFDARAPWPLRGARGGRRLRRRERSGGDGRTAGPAGTRRRPTAIVFANDLMAIAGLSAAVRLGRPRPRRPVDRRVRRHRRRRAHAPGAHDRGPETHLRGAAPRHVRCSTWWSSASTTTGSCPLLGSSSGAPPHRSHAAPRPAPAHRSPTVRRQQPTDPRRPAGRDQPGGNHETFNESSSRRRGPQPHGDGCRPRRQRCRERPAGVAWPDRDLAVQQHRRDRLGQAMVDAWNADHPDEQVTAQEIPAGRHQRRGHRRRDHGRQRAVPDLQHGAGCRAAVREARAGWSSLDELRGRRRTTSPSVRGDRGEQYRSPDGGLYQMPWKANPVMIFYNKAMFEAAGLDPDNPPLGTYDEFLGDRPDAWSTSGVQAAIWPDAGQPVLPAVVRLLPAVHRCRRGQQLVDDGKATFDYRRRVRRRRLLAGHVRRRVGAPRGVHR